MLRAAGIAACLYAGIAGCGDDAGGPAHDASAIDAYPFVDASPLSDGEVLAWVDFATSGCTLNAPTTGDAECHGSAPLAVRFAPIAPEAVEQYLWTFGDGGVSAEVSPEHVFALPGHYDVTLAVAGPDGTAAAARPGFIVVAPAPLGGECSDSLQCGDGRTCLCGDGAACSGGWATGACAEACDLASCAEGACANLGGAAPWSGQWCLPSCDDDCAPGRACVNVPGDAGWVAVCAPAGALAAIGEPCAGPGGLDDALCASGQCAPLGLRGACSATCSTECPDGSACAAFNGALGPLCLADCAAPEVVCDDPWMTCAADGGSGDLGFTPPGGASLDSTYCAPEPCTDSSACPAGTCGAGYCRPAP